MNISDQKVIVNKKPNIYDDFYSDEDKDFFEEEGYELLYVKIKEIKYRKWNDYRYKKNLELISKSGSVVPVRIGEFKNGLYRLTDGNHRCYCCLELGYTHIPAYVWKGIWDKNYHA